MSAHEKGYDHECVISASRLVWYISPNLHTPPCVSPPLIILPVPTVSHDKQLVNSVRRFFFFFTFSDYYSMVVILSLLRREAHMTKIEKYTVYTSDCKDTLLQMIFLHQGSISNVAKVEIQRPTQTQQVCQNILG